jgi:hypothetical protein
MTAFGKMTKPTDSASILISMEPAMKAIGRKISSMVKGMNHGPMELAMKECILKAKSMDKANLHGLTAVHIKENLMRITLRAKAYINGLTVEYMKVNGRTIRWRAMVSSSGPMVVSMKENIWTTRRKEGASFTGLMGASTMASGRMESNMVSAFIHLHRVRLRKANGVRVNELPGSIDHFLMFLYISLKNINHNLISTQVDLNLMIFFMKIHFKPKHILSYFVYYLQFSQY